MGLRPLDLDHWLEDGADAAEQVEMKRLLLSTRRDDVLARCDGSEHASEELLATITAYLARDGRIAKMGARTDPDPLAAASVLVAEDLCVLERGAEEWRLTGAAVCFPSRWKLADKIGTSLDVIHGPVPGYDATLASPTRAFFDRLSVERPVWRLNWTLLDDATLFQPNPGRPATAADPAELFFRVERQTLRRLPASGAIIFTIRTYCTRAGTLVEREPTFATDVLATLATAPSDTLAYKGWTELAPRWADRFGLNPDTPPE
jgi:dimethylamine monooxygenase subunit A